VVIFARQRVTTLPFSPTSSMLRRGASRTQILILPAFHAEIDMDGISLCAPARWKLQD
jgi:hypothetical protein